MSDIELEEHLAKLSLSRSMFSRMLPLLWPARKLIAAAPTADPARRALRRGVSNEEPPSPIRAVDYEHPPRRFREAAPGHLVQEAADL